MQNMVMKRSYTILVNGAFAGTDIQSLKTLPGFNNMSSVITSYFTPINNDCLLCNELNTTYHCKGMIPLVYRADLVRLQNLNSSL